MTRLLLVEDDEIIRRSAARILALEGHDVDEAQTIGRAQELVAERAYDRAILDVQLPDGNGLDLLDWIRRYGPPMDVLVVTGVADRTLTARAFLLGAPLVYKPTPADVIRQFASTPLPEPTSDLRDTTRRMAAEHGLSRRQTDLLLLIAGGAPRRALAAALGVEENTVKTMVRFVLDKTRTPSIDDLRCVLLERAASGTGDDESPELRFNQRPG